MADSVNIQIIFLPLAFHIVVLIDTSYINYISLIIDTASFIIYQVTFQQITFHSLLFIHNFTLPT